MRGIEARCWRGRIGGRGRGRGSGRSRIVKNRECDRWGRGRFGMGSSRCCRSRRLGGDGLKCQVSEHFWKFGGRKSNTLK